eukprot:scaffold9559_cov101-Isochrysis_galbana.AAC.3
MARPIRALKCPHGTAAGMPHRDTSMSAAAHTSLQMRMDRCLSAIMRCTENSGLSLLEERCRCAWFARDASSPKRSHTFGPDSSIDSGASGCWALGRADQWSRRLSSRYVHDTIKAGWHTR